MFDPSDFAGRWLAAWTGNNPETLLSFYTQDAYYRDPGKPAGIQGHEQLRRYFSALLAANPDWRWTPLEVFTTPKGFTLKWHASIPTPGGTIEEDGLDIVELRDTLIARNEVYFDRTNLLRGLKGHSATT